MAVILRILRKLKPIHVVFLLLIIAVIYIGRLQGKVSDQKIVIANHQAANDTLKIVLEDSVSFVLERAAFQTKNIEDALTRKTKELDDYKIFSDNKLEGIRKDLLLTIDRQGERIRSFTALEIEHAVEHFSDSVITHKTIDSLNYQIAYRDSIYIEERSNNVTLKGYVIAQPAFSYYNFSTQIEPFGMEVYITEDRDGTFSTYLLLSDKQTRIPIANSIVSVNDEIGILKRGLFSKFLGHFYVGAGYEYNKSFDDNVFYLRASVSLSRFTQHIKFDDKVMRFLSEFKLWGKK